MPRQDVRILSLEEISKEHGATVDDCKLIVVRFDNFVGGLGLQFAKLDFQNRLLIVIWHNARPTIIRILLGEFLDAVADVVEFEIHLLGKPIQPPLRRLHSNRAIVLQGVFGDTELASLERVPLIPERLVPRPRVGRLVEVLHLLILGASVGQGPPRNRSACRS